jgi:RHS repeat-associated protein
MTSGTNQTGVLQGEGKLAISEGSLSIENGLEASSLGSLTLTNGELIGAGTLNVTSKLIWSGGLMAGSGTTSVSGGASGTIEGKSVLGARTFTNEGTVTIAGEGYIEMWEGATIKNAGTFTVNTVSGLFAESSATSVINTGTLQKTEGSEETSLEVNFENKGTVAAKSGDLRFDSSGRSVTLASGSILEGVISLEGSSVTGDSFSAPNGTISLHSGSLSMAGGDTANVTNFTMQGGTFNGAGTLSIAGTFLWDSGHMEGTGETVVKSGGSGSTAVRVSLLERTLVNEGTFTVTHENYISMWEGAVIRNTGTLDDNASIVNEHRGAEPRIVNTGTFQKSEELGEAAVSVPFENFGTVHTDAGRLTIEHPISVASSSQWGGEPESGSTTPAQIKACVGDPVSCATGNDAETQTDFAIGGRGVGLDLTRTYNSQAAAEGIKGAFGYGWTSSFSGHLVVNKTSKVTTLDQANGGTVPFIEEGGGLFKAPVWTQDTLSGTEGTGYTLTLANQVKYKFAGSGGRLESVTDRNGNATTLTYNGSGQLTTITDPVSRTIKLTYNGEGFVESAEDPMKRVVKYTYENGNLKSVTQPAEAGLRWQFKYDGSHRMTEIVDGRGGKTINEYNGSSQVTKQEDPAGHKLKFEYEPFHTKITNETTGSVTNEYFTSNDEPSSVTRGYGTASATTESFTYNEGGYVTSVTDDNGHTTEYGYDSANDRTSMVDPDSDETKWTYDSTHDVLTMTTSKGETTTIERDGDGNPIKISRPAPASKTQITKYKYTADGELESVTDPLGRKWEYEYDSYGDRSGEIDPEGDKRTWEYNEDSQEIATVSPRGNVVGGEPSKYTTKIERDAQGRAIKVTDPLGRTTKYTYDGDGNLETVTDGNSHTTTYTYNGDNEPIKVEAPNKAVTETEYDGAGEIVKQIDGNKHATEYKRNAVEEVTEVVNPLGKKTLKEYDAAGNLIKLTDPKSRTTTYTYDPANRLTEISYSSGSPTTVKYEYDKDGNRTKMTDGTGTTTYTYDQLDRLTNMKDGHGDSTAYEYDLANEQTKITYPNGKTVERAYDNAGRLHSVTDWLGHVTTFTYDPDSDLDATVFPSATEGEDTYTYNTADQMSGIAMTKGASTLASLAYTRDDDGQVTKTTSKGLPGAENTSYTYDENNRLTEAEGNTYAYDSANNPTTTPGSTNTYNEADELEPGTNATYTYDELGERTKTTPSSGPATTYGYDQAGNLTTVKRPKEGATPEIEDSYGYNGEELRTSQTINGAASYLTWDMTEELPLILSDETNSYIYGPGNLPIEQISSGGTVTYLHHDQQGSTRLLTGSTGTVTGSTTFDAYGNKTGSTGTSTTPLGYDGQYTSSDTGLIYLRARTYDPSTAQFLSVDPLVETTETPYGYAAENPLAFSDPTGFFSLPLVGSISEDADAACGVTFEVPGLDAVACGAAAAATAYVAAKAVSETVKFAAENTSSTSPEIAEGEPEVEEGKSCKIPSKSLPYRGEPNSTEALDRGNGSGQIRDYGPDGLPEKDFDFGHDHGFGDPHAHDWVEGVRQNPGRPIGPNE